MYVVPPPQGTDPGSGSTGGSDALRTYQTWKGSNVSSAPLLSFLVFPIFCLSSWRILVLDIFSYILVHLFVYILVF